jgi:hypothetical protein
VQAIGDGPEREARSRGGGSMAAQRERPPTGAVHDAGGTSAIGAGSGAEGRGGGGARSAAVTTANAGQGATSPRGQWQCKAPRGTVVEASFYFL